MTFSFDADKPRQNQFLIKSSLDYFSIHLFCWRLHFWNPWSSHNQSASKILHLRFWPRFAPPFYWTLGSNFVRIRAYLFSVSHFRLFHGIERRICRTFHNYPIFQPKTQLFVSFHPDTFDFLISICESLAAHFQSRNFQNSPRDFHGNFENVVGVASSHSPWWFSRFLGNSENSWQMPVIYIFDSSSLYNNQSSW